MLRPNYAWGEYRFKKRQSDQGRVRNRAIAAGQRQHQRLSGTPGGCGGNLPAILVVHENRGLNPYIKDVARRLAVAKYIAFAPDGLTSAGGYPGDDEKGLELFRQIDGAKMREDFLAAATWLKSRPDCTGKLGAVGFCFGGGVVNLLAVQMGTGLAAAVASMEVSPALLTRPGSKRRCLRSTANLTHGLHQVGQPLMLH